MSSSSMNTSTSFSGHTNQGLQLGLNSGHVNVNIHTQSQPEGSSLPQPEKRWLDELPIVTQASFDSFERQHDPTCHENTRVEVLNEIRAWADGKDERRIYWLNGLAGTGKSTIARTIAREYSRRGASFFFSKGGGDAGHARKLFTTIAFQFARTSSTLRRYICGAVSENPDIRNKSLHDQWSQLILQPFSKLDEICHRSTYILVIDALDECEGKTDILTILKLLAEVRSLKTVQLRVFLTSRRETRIQHGFDIISDAEHQDFILHEILTSTIDHDICIFLEYNFKLIREQRLLEASWPGKKAIECLVQKASGLFIWAATACRFVLDGKQFAVRRLALILAEGNIDSATAPEKYLNELYDTVLKQSINANFMDEEREDVYGMLRKILGSIVVLFSPLSAASLCGLLHVTNADFNQTLEELHAILNIPKDQTRPLRLHHPSFRDFLLNKERCRDTDIYIDKKKAHHTLLNKSIYLMKKSLKKNICCLDTYSVSVTDIDSSRVQQCLSPAVQYACLYWTEHLQMSGDQLYDDGHVHQFLQEHALHWLEALSWMQKVSEGIYAIISLESIALNSSCPVFYAFIHDIKRFALYSRSAIEQSPLQVYCGALIFAPMMSLVRKQFENCIPCWIKRLPEVESGWNVVLQTLEGHSDIVNAVAFSPDGKVLASASDDQTVKLWDTSTGGALQTLQSHLYESVSAVAFSPDGKVLASASKDGTVKLSDANTGGALQTLEGHSYIVNALVFSPDGKVLASASADQTVILWPNASTERALHSLNGHSDSVNAVCFSPDSKVLASASYDQMVKLWDVSTGGALQTLKGHSSCVNAVAFSPNGKVLASASEDHSVKLWDASTGGALQTFYKYSNTVCFSPDSKVLASASYGKGVQLWDASTGEVLQTLAGHSDLVNAVAFSPDGKVLASASDDRTVKLWNASTERALQTRVKGHLKVVNPVCFSPNGKVLASASNGQTVNLWDPSTRGASQTLEGHSGLVLAVAFSPDSKVLASASYDKTVKLWDASTGGALQTLLGHSDSVTAMCFSPDSKVLASASNDRTVKLWDASTGKTLETFKGHPYVVRAVAFSPDGKVLALKSDSNMVKLWDTSTGAVKILEGLYYSVNAMCFSPDGKVLASASDDKTVKLWDASTAVELQTLEVDAVIKTVSFINDGVFLRTDRGILCATHFSNREVPSRQVISHGVFVKEQWITWGMKNVIWLPPEYRSSSIVVHGNFIVLGHRSDRLSILELAF